MNASRAATQLGWSAAAASAYLRCDRELERAVAPRREGDDVPVDVSREQHGRCRRACAQLLGRAEHCVKVAVAEVDCERRAVLPQQRARAAATVVTVAAGRRCGRGRKRVERAGDDVLG